VRLYPEGPSWIINIDPTILPSEDVPLPSKEARSLRVAWRLNALAMATSIRFENLTPTGQSDFVDEARSRHPQVDPAGPAFTLSVTVWHPGWGCSRCGWGYPLEDVLVADGEPECPHCGETGWFHVQPRSMPNALQ
jgi:rubredoxin